VESIQVASIIWDRTLSGGRTAHQRNIARLLADAARIERQAALYENGRQFDFLISEAALRFRPVPYDALAAQHDKILSVSTLPGVNVAVMPTGAVQRDMDL
jgi:hypothetical protein